MVSTAKSSPTSVLEVGRNKTTPHTGIENAGRARSIAGLSNLLGGTYALLVQTQLVHWNVTGPAFRSIHLITEEQYKALFEAADEIAERIRALGEVAPTKPTTIELAAPRAGTTALAMLQGLIEAHEEATKRARDVADHADEDEDFVTHDLVTRRMEFHEKAIWMLRAMTTDR